jgi:hypothetical protein
MGTWTEEELAIVGAADELYVSTRRLDGSLRRGIPIWHVRIRDAIYIRSAYGPENGWFRRAKRTGLGRISSGGVEKDVTFEPTAALSDEITAAYRAKYDRYGPALVRTVTGGDVLGTTLRVVPRD